ncbi:beta-lactamase family protein [Couchioplanes caeruleus]|uniref:serine hydrolase domain-containing protein n=1 Tax=Couchioplanes caeruleus TaxID=56438 RepID=UPI0020BDCF06|nr:serine hydrolase domain-containing protein [Couchioplanes caeruleus]UQU63458.1 beta-lactamase family protein [Couchioplanes caeruleus]
MALDSVRGIARRRVLAWSGAAAAGVPLVGAPAAGARSSIPPDARPGGAYDRYVAKLAADGRFSGVVLLSHRGRTVLSRSYGMADRERGIRNHEGTAFSLSSAGKPFHAVAILQLAQRGKLQLSDPVGKYLRGLDKEIAERVSVHHLLSGASGLAGPEEDVERVFRSRAEVHAYYVHRAEQSTLVDVPGLPSTTHAEPEVLLPALVVEAVAGTTYWDYVEQHVFRRCGMTGSGFFTRPRWLTDGHVAHPYMEVAGGSVVDAVRHLDAGSAYPYLAGRNPARAFIDAPGDGGFATAPDLVRFAYALRDGTLLDRPWADVLTGAKLPHGPASFGAYGVAIDIVGGQWAFQRAGGNPGVGANWSIYPDTGWVGVILGNCDGAPLEEMIARETAAVTGVVPEGGAGG